LCRLAGLSSLAVSCTSLVGCHCSLLLRLLILHRLGLASVLWLLLLDCNGPLLCVCCAFLGMPCPLWGAPLVALLLRLAAAGAGKTRAHSEGVTGDETGRHGRDNSRTSSRSGCRSSTGAGAGAGATRAGACRSEMKVAPTVRITMPWSQKLTETLLLGPSPSRMRGLPL